MTTLSNSPPNCPCGRSPQMVTGSSAGERREIVCPCGRRLDVAWSPDGWTLRGFLTPERSVPVSGRPRISTENPDTERYWFEHRGGLAGKRVIVHVVLSPSAKEAQVKALGMKALHVFDVTSPVEARRRWIDRHEAPGETQRSRRARSGPDAGVRDAEPPSGSSAP